MKFKRGCLIILVAFLAKPFAFSGQSINVEKLQKIRLKQYLAGGLVWQGESTQNTNWNKICETPDGKLWFSGGDHWGVDGITGNWDMDDRYERPWGFGNTVVCYYDPQHDRVIEAFELNRASVLYANAESPGHGKIHANIISDSKGNIYTGGYMGSSYLHEYTRAFYPKSYVGGAIIKYNPMTKDVDYFGVPCPYGAIVALYYDEKRNIMNGVSVDRAKFWRVNLTTMELNIYESIARMSRLDDRVREFIMDNDGICYFANDVGGLTKFDPDSETFTDLDLTLPGKFMDFRASVVSSKNVIYCVSTDGMIWSYTPHTGKLEILGHVLGLPEQPHYTPNIALDEEWNRLYFIAGNHGGQVLEGALQTLTIMAINTKKLYWVGTIEGLEGCFGALVARDHTVYFSSFGHVYEGDGILTDKSDKSITRPFLLRYDPPEDIELYEQ